MRYAFLFLILVAVFSAFPADFPLNCFNSTSKYVINGNNFTLAYNATPCYSGVATTNANYGWAGAMAQPNNWLAGNYVFATLYNQPIGQATVEGAYSGSYYTRNDNPMTLSQRFASPTIAVGNYSLIYYDNNGATNGALNLNSANFTNSSGSTISFDTTTEAGWITSNGTCFAIVKNSSGANISVCNNGYLDFAVALNSTYWNDVHSVIHLNYITGFPDISANFTERTGQWYNLNSTMATNLGMYISNNNNWVTRADSISNAYVTSPPSSYIYSAYILFGSSYLITPKLTYTPGNYSVYPYWYNSTDASAYLIPNQASYIIDSATSTCYFIPPYIPADLTAKQTVYATLCTNGSVAAYLQNPTIYLSKNCWQDSTNSSYNVDVNSIESRTFNLQIVYGNSTVLNIPYTVKHLITSVELTNVTNVTLTSANETVCAWNTDSSGFIQLGIPATMFNSMTKIIASIFIVAMMVLSAYVPISFLAVIILNDLFQIMGFEAMISAFSMIFLIAVINNHEGERTLKALGVYIAIAIAIILRFFALSNVSNTLNCTTKFNGVTYDCANAIQALSDSLTGIASADNIATFLTGGFSFIYNFCLFIIQLPLIITAIITSALFAINPILGTSFGMFGSVLTIGIYLWVILRAYELLTKQYIKT